MFVSNDNEPAFLFRNREGRRFEEVALAAGVAYTEIGKEISGMGADARDFDNDGRTDIFQTALDGETMPLFRNRGGMTFEDWTGPAGLVAPTLASTGWSNGIVDFNNDGWKDLFVAGGGVVHPKGDFAERAPRTSTVYVNLKNGRFADASAGAGAAFASRKAVHRGAAFGDLDDDGRVDAVVSALEAPLEIWRNVSPAPSHWLLVRTVGTKSNRDGVGARIRVTTASGDADEPRQHGGRLRLRLRPARPLRARVGLRREGAADRVAERGGPDAEGRVRRPDHHRPRGRDRLFPGGATVKKP